MHELEIKDGSKMRFLYYPLNKPLNIFTKKLHYSIHNSLLNTLIKLYFMKDTSHKYNYKNDSCFLYVEKQPPEMFCKERCS